MDQVLAGDLEKSRLSDVKAAFIIGLNEGVLPKKFTDDGILADEDREKIIQNGLKIAPSSKTRLLDEEFIAYLAFTTPSDSCISAIHLQMKKGMHSCHLFISKECKIYSLNMTDWYT